MLQLFFRKEFKMKKVIKLLLAALLSLAIMSCSDSESYESALSRTDGYKTFSAVRSAWKEPSSYSYTVHIKFEDYVSPDEYIIDVKVNNEKSTLSVNPSCRKISQDHFEYIRDRIKRCNWNIETIAGILDSINKKSALDSDKEIHNVYTDTCKKPETDLELIHYNVYHKTIREASAGNNYVALKYDKVNSISIPTDIYYASSTDGFYESIEITDFKILSE